MDAALRPLPLLLIVFVLAGSSAPDSQAITVYLLVQAYLAPCPRLLGRDIHEEHVPAALPPPLPPSTDFFLPEKKVQGKR